MAGLGLRGVILLASVAVSLVTVGCKSSKSCTAGARQCVDDREVATTRTANARQAGQSDRPFHLYSVDPRAACPQPPTCSQLYRPSRRARQEREQTRERAPGRIACVARCNRCRTVTLHHLQPAAQARRGRRRVGRRQGKIRARGAARGIRQACGGRACRSGRR